MIKRFRITTRAFASLFAAGEHPAFKVISDALPPNVRIEQVRLGGDISEGQMIEFMLSSPDFADGSDDLTPTMQRLVEEAAQSGYDRARLTTSTENYRRGRRG